MKKVLSIILSLVFIFALASCKNESTQTKTQKADITQAITEKESQSQTDTAPLQSEPQTEKDEVLSPAIKPESPYIKTDGKLLSVKLNPKSVEEIEISYLISSSVDKPTQKFIRDRKTIEKIIELINNTKFNVCENQDEIRKPGTTLIIKIDDKISMSFQMDLVINGTYCKEPESFSNDILKFYNEAPEKAEPIK